MSVLDNNDSLSATCLTESTSVSRPTCTCEPSGTRGVALASILAWVTLTRSSDLCNKRCINVLKEGS